MCHDGDCRIEGKNWQGRARVHDVVLDGVGLVVVVRVDDEGEGVVEGDVAGGGGEDGALLGQMSDERENRFSPASVASMSIRHSRPIASSSDYKAHKTSL